MKKSYIAGAILVAASSAFILNGSANAASLEDDANILLDNTSAALFGLNEGGESMVRMISADGVMTISDQRSMDEDNLTDLYYLTDGEGQHWLQTGAKDFTDVVEISMDCSKEAAQILGYGEGKTNFFALFPNLETLRVCGGYTIDYSALSANSISKLYIGSPNSRNGSIDPTDIAHITSLKELTVQNMGIGRNLDALDSVETLALFDTDFADAPYSEDLDNSRAFAGMLSLKKLTISGHSGSSLVNAARLADINQLNYLFLDNRTVKNPQILIDLCEDVECHLNNIVAIESKDEAENEALVEFFNNILEESGAAYALTIADDGTHEWRVNNNLVFSIKAASLIDDINDEVEGDKTKETVENPNTIDAGIVTTIASLVAFSGVAILGAKKFIRR